MISTGLCMGIHIDGKYCRKNQSDRRERREATERGGTLVGPEADKSQTRREEGRWPDTQQDLLGVLLWEALSQRKKRAKCIASLVGGAEPEKEMSEMYCLSC